MVKRRDLRPSLKYSKDDVSPSFMQHLAVYATELLNNNGLHFPSLSFLPELVDNKVSAS